MVPSRIMKTKIIAIAGPTGSGKSARAVAEALDRGGEVISVDSRQIYRGLDIGTEKTLPSEMLGVPHHLIDIREVGDAYSAADFATDAARLIGEISAHGRLPILAGGTSFYFDALLRPLPDSPTLPEGYHESLVVRDSDDLYREISARDPRRAAELDPSNHRRLVRALELVEAHGSVPLRATNDTYDVEWIIIDSPREELRPRIDARLTAAFDRGLVAEVATVAAAHPRAVLDELGLEYKLVGEYLRGERTEESLRPALSAKLWQYARRQKAWLRKLADTYATVGAPQRRDID